MSFDWNKIKRRERLLNWEQSDCDSSDDDRDFILDATVPWDTGDDEPSFIYFIVTRGGDCYCEYESRLDRFITPRQHRGDMIATLIHAEEWARKVLRDRQRQGKLVFTSQRIGGINARHHDDETTKGGS